MNNPFQLPNGSQEFQGDQNQGGVSTPNVLQQVPPLIPQDSVYERNDAKSLYLLHFIAKNSQRNQLADLDFNLAAKGLSPDAIDLHHEAIQNQQTQEEDDAKAMKMAMDSMGQSDKEYQASLDQLNQEGQNQPQRETVGAPQLSGAEAGLGLLATLLDPHHAAQNAGTVLTGRVNANQAQQKSLDQNYAVQQDQHQEKVQTLQRQATIQQGRVLHAQSVVDHIEKLKTEKDDKHAKDLNEKVNAYLRSVGNEKQTTAAAYNASLRPDEQHLAITPGRIKVDIEEDLAKQQANSTKFHSDQVLSYTKIAEDDNKSPGARQRAMFVLSRIDPEGPYGGMTIEQIQKAAEDLSPKGKQIVEKTKTEIATRAGKVQKLVDAHDISGARKLKIEADTALTKVRAIWLPKEKQAQITAAEARAKASEAKANDSLGGMLGGMKAGRLITATAFFNQKTAIQKSLADIDASAQMSQSEATEYESKLARVKSGDLKMYAKNGDEIDQQKAIQDLEYATAHAKTAAAYWSSRGKALHAVLDGIEKQVVPDQVPAKEEGSFFGGTRKFVKDHMPVTVSPGSMPSSYQERVKQVNEALRKKQITPAEAARLLEKK